MPTRLADGRTMRSLVFVLFVVSMAEQVDRQGPGGDFFVCSCKGRFGHCTPSLDLSPDVRWWSMHNMNRLYPSQCASPVIVPITVLKR